MRLCRPHSFGDCRLGCHLWQGLGLDEFWSARLDSRRSDISWTKVLKLLVANRLIRPGREFHIHRQWFDRTAIDELLSTDYRIAAKDRLYRCPDRILEHKEQLCKYLKSQWKDMFGIRKGRLCGGNQPPRRHQKCRFQCLTAKVGLMTNIQ